MDKRTFLKLFFAFLVAFALVFMPIVKAVSNVNLFNTDVTKNIQGDNADSRKVFIAQTGSFHSQYKDIDRLNILAMGVNNKMTDTIMLVSWDMKDNSVDVISVPRDTYYHRPGYEANSEKKINAIYASEGVKAIAEAVSDVLYGIEINYYAIIDYNAVKTIVDSVGGVPMDVKRNMHYEDPYDTPPLVINLKKGPQILDGEHAVQFLRYRHGYVNGDLGRVEAQQEFIKSLYQQGIKNGILSSARVVTENIKSNLTVGAACRYALSALTIKNDSIETWIVPGVPRYIDETSYYIQSKEATKEMLDRIYSGKDSFTEEEGASSEAEA